MNSKPNNSSFPNTAIRTMLTCNPSNSQAVKLKGNHNRSKRF